MLVVLGGKKVGCKAPRESRGQLLLLGLVGQLGLHHPSISGYPVRPRQSNWITTS